jgi:hypothetical protein
VAVKARASPGSGRDRLERRVVEAAEAALAERKYVTPIDVLVGLGWLQPRRVDEWRQGRVDYLERVTQANLRKLSRAMSIFRRWATSRGLKPSETGCGGSGDLLIMEGTGPLCMAAPTWTTSSSWARVTRR